MKRQLKKFLIKSWEEGTQIDRSNIATAVFVGGSAHIFLYFLYTHIIPMPYESLTLRLLTAGLCISTGFYYYLPKKIQSSYFPFYWHLMIITALTFNTTFLLLKNNFNPTYLYWEIFVTLLLALYVPNWFIYIVDWLISKIAAVSLYFITTPIPNFKPDFDIFGYGFILAFTIISAIIFVNSNRAVWLNKKQKQEHKKLTAIAASIVHEIRNPLSNIRLAQAELKNIIPLVDEKMRSKLIEINQVIDLSAKQSDDIITIVLSDLSEKHINPADFNVSNISDSLSESVKNYGYQSNQEKDRVKLLIDENNNFKIKIIPSRLNFILFNLIKNALYYTGEFPNSIITISAEKRLIDGVNWNAIYVYDQGPGIPQEILPKLFDDFFTSGKKGGTGVGLSFCRRNMKIFGGDIICESEFGGLNDDGSKKAGWTKFSLLFPIVQEEEMAIKTTGVDFQNNAKNSSVIPADNIIIYSNNIIQTINNADLTNNLGYEAANFNNNSTESAQITSGPAIMNFSPENNNEKPIKILLVDDQKVNLMMNKNKITSTFPTIACHTANSGAEALQMFKASLSDDKNKYQLILMDIEMPGQDGIYTSGEIRKLEKKNGIIDPENQVPLIAFTTLSIAELSERVVSSAGKNIVNPAIKILSQIADNTSYQKIFNELTTINEAFEKGTGTQSEIQKYLGNLPINDYHLYFDDYLYKSNMTANELYRTLGKWLPELNDELNYIGDREQYLPLLQGKKVLLADDQELNRKIVRRSLENIGMEVFEVSNGLELIDFYQRSLSNDSAIKYDLILTDINMPPYNGDEASLLIRMMETVWQNKTQNDQEQNNSAANISIDYKHLPILAMTGNDNNKTALRHFLHCQINDYFIKGSNTELLIKTIARICKTNFKKQNVFDNISHL